MSIIKTDYKQTAAARDDHTKKLNDLLPPLGMMKTRLNLI